MTPGSGWQSYEPGSGSNNTGFFLSFNINIYIYACPFSERREGEEKLVNKILILALNVHKPRVECRWQHSLGF